MEAGRARGNHHGASQRRQQSPARSLGGTALGDERGIAVPSVIAVPPTPPTPPTPPSPPAAPPPPASPPPADLTPEQRRIVEWGDGPAVVIAGAGTGKTRVIVERVRHLLATTPDLLPEQLLVLTYNVKAAAELQQRLDQAVGVATRSRMTVSNFHSFCQRLLTEHAADAGLPPRPDVLDGVGQVLLIRDIRPQLGLVYHATDWWLGSFVQFINRAKDELVGPDHFAAFVAEERRAFEARYGSFDAARERLERNGNLAPLRWVRGAYAQDRARERAGEGSYARAHTKAAEREARRTIAGDGIARPRSSFDRDDSARIDRLAATYEADGAALEVLRLEELERVYRAYMRELEARGALDFGEQIAAVAQLLKTRTNILRALQRRYRYLLVDEFQDANVAQIELIELLGRAPDRPDNVMVVGDDDQSIYRFRGASFAAFAEFDARFGRPPAHAPDSTPPGPPPRLRIEQNFRSVRHVLTAANRLIVHNDTRFEPDKRLTTDKPDGDPVELVVCAGDEDEAVAIVDAISALAGPGRPRPWSHVAILYRKHRHREAIVKRLRDEDIPYTVVGGLSLFETPEIRDLEQGLRAIADPHDGGALVRMMTAGPWRLDPLEILAVTRRANRDETTVFDAATAHAADDTVAPTTRARLHALLETLGELHPLTFRDGPHTIVERYLERTGQVLDLIATGTLEAKRTVANLASFVRFAADWQQANPRGTLAGFVDYLDAYQGAGGELPTSVELVEDVDGVRLMTLYQAKGLEFPVVFVPRLLDGEWPVKEQGNGWFPPELLREAVPEGDIHTDEERRLLYVAMTRAQERLVLTTHGGTSAEKQESRFVGELLEGAGEELRRVDRTAAVITVQDRLAESLDRLAADADADDGDEDGDADAAAAEPSAPSVDDAIAAVRRVMPLPTARERRLQLRLRAAELVGLIEATKAGEDGWPEGDAARDGFAAELADVGQAAALAADEARARGLDPLTFRTLALDSGAGANLLQVAALPPAFSYSALSTYDRCGLQYAFRYVYRMPEPARPASALTFGSTAHGAFEAFTKLRRERAAQGEPPPTRDDLDRLFRERWTPEGFADRTSEASYQRRVETMLDNFWTAEVSTLGDAIAEEEPFELRLDPGDGSPLVVIGGSIDRIDRLPSGRVEVIDYKTGKVSSQASVDESLQLSIYALACCDALGLGTPERVTLYFTESATRMSTTRTDEQLDQARADILARVARIRSGEFTATPGRACGWCDYRAMCPARSK